MTLTKYLTGDVALSTLASSTLRWSTPSSFNDPEEAGALGPLTAEQVRHALFQRIFDDHYTGERPARGSWAVVTDLAHRLCGVKGRKATRGMSAVQDALRGAWSDDELMALVHAQWSAMVSRLRVLCLSSVDDSTLMWSHYADGHRGAVLIFDSVGLLSHQPSHMIKVEYGRQARPTPEWWARTIRGEHDADVVAALLPFVGRKGSHWAYEQEHRIVRCIDAGQGSTTIDLPFSPSALRTIVLGVRMPESQRDAVRRQLKSDMQHVDVVQATIAGHDNVARHSAT